MAVSKRLRYEILRRDGHRCRYCGAGPEEHPLTVDHVIPMALGGGDEPTNLVAACRDCNAGKSASSPDAPIVEAVSDDALRWAAALEVAARQLEDELFGRTSYADAFLKQWNGWTFGGEPAPLPMDWRQSLAQFYALNLPWTIVVEAVDIATARRGVDRDNRFKYFAGVCWGHVRQMQDHAREIVAPDPILDQVVADLERRL